MGSPQNGFRSNRRGVFVRNYVGKESRTNPIQLQPGHLSTIRDFIYDANGNLKPSGYPAAYEFIAGTLGAMALDGHSIDLDTVYWFSKASDINANRGPAARFIRSYTNNGRLLSGSDNRHLPSMQAVSNEIAFQVLDEVLRTSQVAPLYSILARDIEGAIQDGGVNGLAGWGGSFYYWDLPIADANGRPISEGTVGLRTDYLTIGDRIMRDPAQLQLFINTTIRTIGGMASLGESFRSGVQDPGGVISALGALKDLPTDIKGQILRGVSREHPIFGFFLRNVLRIGAGEDDGYDETIDKLIAVFTEVQRRAGDAPVTLKDIGGAILDGVTNLDGAQLGLALGSVLGRRLTDDPFGQVVASGVLSTALGAIGELIDIDLLDGTPSTAINASLLETLGSNILNAGVGSVSSYLTAELFSVLGDGGLPAELSRTVAGAYVTAIITNLPALATNAKSLSEVLNGVRDSQGNLISAGAINLPSIVGSFIGSKLAAEVVTFSSVGGQIGSAVGGLYGGFAASATLASLGAQASAAAGGSATGALAAAQWAAAHPLAAVAIVAAIVFIDTIVGGLIGSIFSGTPRSAADVVYDEEAGQFSVANVVSRKSGSKDSARQLAIAAANVYNHVLANVDGTLLDVATIKSGTYGMRKKDYVYSTVSGTDKDNITQRFSGTEGAKKLIEYGSYVGLTDVAQRLAGGDVYVKRALLATLQQTSAVSGGFSQELLLGNISTARDYAHYLSNAGTINALITADERSSFAASWVITLARAGELGLYRRASTDWTGGFAYFLQDLSDETGGVVGAANVKASISLETGERLWTLYDSFGDLTGYLKDTIEAGSDTRIAGTAGDDIITAVTPEIDVAATIDAGDGHDIAHASDRGDNVFGGAGNDTLYGGALDDWLLGGDGDDVLHAGSQAGLPGGDGNYLDGGAGNDQLHGREGSDWLEGGDGVDMLDGGRGDDILAGGAGAGDDLKGGHGDDQYLVRLGDGADTADEVASGAVVGAAPATDPIRARIEGIRTLQIQRNWLGDEADFAEAARINDVTGTPTAVAAVAAGGEDAIVLGQGIGMGDIKLIRPKDAAGNDLPDLLVQVMATDPETGVESFTGTELRVKDWFTNPFKRVEWLKFADGNEIRIADIQTFIIGTAGDDILNGTDGNDFVYGGGGNDQIRLYDGDDIGSGGTGDDVVWGDGDKDLVIGGLGDDKLFGGTHADVLSGDDGDDELMGDEGDDTLSGGRGDDRLAGGAGADTIKFSRGDGRDTLIADASEVDETSGTWETVWDQTGEWNEDGGYTLEAVRDMDWGGRFRMNHSLGRVERFTGTITTTVASGRDTIEFALGINIQDITLSRQGSDLTLVIGRDNSDLADAGQAADSITIKDWYSSADWSSNRPVGKFVFYQTGILDVGGEGWTLVAGSDGNDGSSTTPLSGTAGKDWITGGAGDDIVAGGHGDDILHGNGGHDELRGEAGTDVLYGGSGDDVLDGGAAADVLIGGTGLDTASYASASSGVRVNLAATYLNTGEAAGDQYSDIENLLGGSGADRLGGDAGDNELTGGGGNDVLQGDSGDDAYIWRRGDGADTIDEGAYSVSEVMGVDGALRAGLTASRVLRTEDTYPLSRYTDLSISDGNTVYYQLTVEGFGAYGDDPTTWPDGGWKNGYAPNGNGHQVVSESIGRFADAGSDTLEFGPDISLDDLTFARNGNDLVITVDGDAASRITIRAHFTTGGRVETLQLHDGLAVALTELLMTTPGVSELTGGAADEFLAGDGGANRLSGGVGHDTLSGGDGSDVLIGGDGDDVLEGGKGADHLDGGTHSATDTTGWGDTVRYAGSNVGVVIDLRNTTTGQAGGDAAGDVLTGIENVVGSGLGDTIQGDEGGNRLHGLGGDDELSGAGGDDVLIGDAGNDTLHGDAGVDDVKGGDGDDRLHGGDGNDFLYADAGNDIVHGDAGDDRMWGGDGNDGLRGGDGDDQLHGGDGIDVLTGDAGHDLLDGGTGDDRLEGGAGDDSYYFERGAGVDRIVDAQGRNRILFGDEIANADLWLTREGNDLRIAVLGSADSVVVEGFYVTDPRSVRSIGTATHSLYLSHAETLAFVDAMTAWSAANGGLPSTVPDDLASQAATLWREGDKSAPVVSPGTRRFDATEDGVLTIAGASLGVVDYDENITGYALKAGAAPAHGLLTIDPPTGDFTYTPSANFHGDDAFVLVVTDADGQSAEIQVAISVASVDDAPSALEWTPAVTSIVERDRVGPDETLEAIELGRLAIIDADNATADYVLSVPVGSPFEVRGDRLYLKAGANAALDHEAASSISVTVVASDPDNPGHRVERIVTFAIADRDDVIEGNDEANHLQGQSGRDIIRGHGGDDVLIGGVGDDRLEGGAGNDHLYGESGADTLIGGAGDDVYHVDDAADVVAEAEGGGNDTLHVAISYALAAGQHVETMTLQQASASNLDLTGNELDNNIYGNAGSNRLAGAAGNDLLAGLEGDDELDGGLGDDHLDGGAGRDRMAGGAGNDVYIVRETNDEIVERAGEGMDTLHSSVSYVLAAGQEVERMYLHQVSTNNLDLTGNEFGNEIYGNDGANRLHGGGGNDHLAGYSGNDDLVGGDGDDRLEGGGGNDGLNGGAGADNLDGGDGVDTATYAGNPGAVWIDLAAGTARWNSAEGDRLTAIENVVGTDDSDRLYGDAGVNHLIGGLGDDLLGGRGGADVLDGGAGIDTATYADTIGSVWVNLTTGIGEYTDAEGDRLANIENVIGTNWGDRLVGDGGSNKLEGGAGDDVLSGEDGADILLGGDGEDRLAGGVGHDHLEGGAGRDHLEGGDDVDLLLGGDGDDYLDGGEGNDYIQAWIYGGPAPGGLAGGAGNDTLVGGNGQDALFGEADDDLLIADQDAFFDYLDGGVGSDTVSFERFTFGVTANMNAGKDGHYTARVFSDGWVSIENVTGSQQADALTGDAHDNILTGLGGNDVISGGAGADRLHGGAGDDVLAGEGGADVLDGGAGIDTATYAGAIGSVWVNLATGIGEYADAQGDRLTNIENVVGTSWGDRLVGDGGANELDGAAGDDVIYGGDGADILRGGDGGDIIYGEGGDDLLYSGEGSNTLDGGAGHDILWGGGEWDDLIGGDGDDTLYGQGGNDAFREAGTDRSRRFVNGGLEGGAGDDLLYGGSGDDRLDGGAGADLLDGGDGFDGADYSRSSAAVVVNLTTGAGSGGDAAGDTLRAIEYVEGSAFNDTLVGSAGDDVLRGGAGNDRLEGLAGSDHLLGGDGDDVLVGGDDGDYLFGGAGRDTLDAGSAGDWLEGGAGDDRMIGGEGDDIYSIARGDGHDDIDAFDQAGFDHLSFKPGISYNHLWFDRVNDSKVPDANGLHLRLSILGDSGAEGSVTIRNWFLTSQDRIDLFTDGFDRATGGEVYIPALLQIMNDVPAAQRPATIAGMAQLIASNEGFRNGLEASWFRLSKPRISDVSNIVTTEPLDGEVRDVSFSVRAWHEVGESAVTVPPGSIQLQLAAVSGSLADYVASWSAGAPDASGNRTVTMRLTQNGSTHLIANGSLPLSLSARIKGVYTPDSVAIDTFNLTIAPNADTPTASMSTQGGNAGTYIPLNLTAVSPDTDGSERVDVLIGGLPAGYLLTNAAGQIVGARESQARPASAFMSGLNPLAISSRANTQVIEKTAGAFEIHSNSSAYWTASASSSKAMDGDFILRGKAVTGSTSAFVAMTADPEADNHYASLDYGIQIHHDGRAYIYENGAHRGTHQINGQVWLWRSGSSIFYGTGPDFATASTTGVLRRVDGVSGPLYFDSSAALGQMIYEAEVVEAPIRLSQAELAGLRLFAPAGRHEDARLSITPQSFDGSSTRRGATQRLTVPINVAPDGASVGGVGLTSAPSVVEFTPDSNPAGRPVSVVTPIDRDRRDANLLGADLSSLVPMGGGEERITTAIGPDGVPIRVLETGQFAGRGSDGSRAGGGTWTGLGPADTSKAYKFTVFVKGQNGLSHESYFGTFGNIEDASVGHANSNPYFWYGNLSGDQDRWYRIEGYVLPAGHPLVEHGAFGGVYDAATGEKVAKTATFRFGAGGSDAGIRFFSYYGQANEGYSALWAQPTVEKLDYTFALLDSAGGRFAINQTSGLITAVDTNFDYESAPSHNVTIRVTDAFGQSKDQVVTVGVTNVNEAPNRPTGPTRVYFDESGLGANPANHGVVVATFGLSDPDRTTPTLEFTNNPGNRFSISGNQVLFNGSSFDFEAFRAAGHGVADYNGDGRIEAHVGDIWVRARDGTKVSDHVPLQVFVQDVAEAPNAPTGPWHVYFDETGLGANPASRGLAVATYGLSDPDGPVPALEIVSNPGNLFYLDGATVRFAGSNYDYEALCAAGYGYGDYNHDGRAEVHLGALVVRASDGGRVSSTTTTHVFIHDINERPNALTLQSQVLHREGISGDTPHRYQTIATFGVSDPDRTTPALQIVGGNQHGWFTTAGNQLTFGNAWFTADWLRSSLGQYGQDAGFYYDTDGDGLKEIRVATLTLAAVDSHGAQSDPFSYNVLIEEQNEAPYFHANPFTFGVQENPGWYQYVGTASASDPDFVAGEMRYLFSNQSAYYWDGNLQRQVSASSDGRFVMSALDGQIWTRGSAAIDYETTSVITHGVTVYDRGGGLHHRQVNGSVQINVHNVNDTAPLTPQVQSWGTTVFNENSGAGQTVAVFAQANDGDRGLNSTVFELMANPGGFFEIVGQTLRVRSDRHLDYEALASGGSATTIQIRVRAHDGTYASPDYALTVQINNMNDHSTWFTQVPVEFFVMENTGVGTIISDGVRAVDGDGFGIAYSIDPGSNPNGAFAINSAGQIVIGNGVDHEQPGWLSDGAGKYANLIIRASDGGAAVTTNVRVRIGNEVLQVVAPSGAMSARYRTEWNSWRTDIPIGGEEWNEGPQGHQYQQWYSEVRYIDSWTGAVILIDGAHGPDAYTTYRMLPDPAYAWLAEGYRYTGNGRELISDDEYNGNSLAPLVFDLTGQGLDNALGGSIEFDLHGKGKTRSIGWINQGFGFLALDTDLSGAIDSAMEISFTQYKKGAKTDLEGLAAFDSNRDGMISAGDERFGEFLMWEDIDRDGKSASGELKSLAELGIVSIDLTPTPTTRTLANKRGSVILNTASFSWANGSVGMLGDAVLRPAGKEDIVEHDPNAAKFVPTARLAAFVLDVDGDGSTLVGLDKSKAGFDTDGDGVREDIGWIDRKDALLVFDRDGDGRIARADEISFLGDVVGARSNMQGLAAFDTNGDYVLSTADTAFATFRLWFDKNGNGKSDKNELVTLEEAGIVAIRLAGRTVQNSEGDTGGNMVYMNGSFLFADGRQGSLVDAGLAYRPAGSGSAQAAATGDEDIALAAPIVFDFDGNASGLVSINASAAQFDMDGDGDLDRTGWITRGDALLALDRNRDGRITDIAEISFVGDKPGALTDLQGLAAFDSNGDGRLTAADARFAEFKLWFDNDGNGVSDAGELLSLAEAGVREIGLSSVSVPSNGPPANGNRIHGLGRFVREDGSTGTLLDAALAYSTGPSDTATDHSVWNGQPTPSTAVEEGEDGPPVDAEPEIKTPTFETRRFDRDARKYHLIASGGEMIVGLRKANSAIDPRTGEMEPATMLSFKDKRYGMLAPIILDLDGDGIEMRSIKKSKAWFDMNGDGTRDDTGWHGKGDGFLVIDRDGDGRITGAAELSFLSEKEGARSDLDALAALDSNKDGKLDAADQRFGELKVWADRDGDGTTDTGELRTLAEHGIASIDLARRATDATAKIGDNILLSTATFTRTNGLMGTVGDAALAFKPGRTSPVLPEGREGLDGLLEPRLQALRDGVDRNTRFRNDGLRYQIPAHLDPFDYFASPGPDADRAEDAGGLSYDTQDLPSGPIPDAMMLPPNRSNDLRLALMTQHMAAFGARSGEAQWDSRRGPQPAYDYFTP